MTVKNNIPAGYKDSAVGVIPQEWEVKRLVDLCQNTGDYGINAPSVPYREDLPTYLRITDIDGWGKFIETDKVSVDNPNSSQFILREGDIVFARTGATVGKTYLYDSKDGQLVFAGFLIRFTPNSNKAIPYYIKASTETASYWNWVRIISQRSGQPGINSVEYGAMKLAVPPLAEQRKIAEILGVWDEAIEKQNRLIEKLELRKRALMQRLLTGRTRLSGFIDDVQYKKLKPFIVEKSERNTNQTYTNVLSVTNNRGFINQAEQFDREVASDNTANYKLVHRGQFAYNPSRVNVGSLDLLQTYDLGILSPMYIVFETRPTMDPKFLHYQLKSGWFVGHIPMYVQGSVRDSLSFDGLENMKFWIPSLTEQKAIAEVLTTADNEIATHRKKLDALRLQKHGLMQQLLTGKTRVKI